MGYYVTTSFFTRVCSSMGILVAGAYTGQKLLDFGCGPVIEHAISLSRYLEEIYFADFETKS